MSSRALVTLLGLLAAFLFALAAFMQHRVARRTTPGGDGILSGLYALMSTLLRNAAWLLGWLVNLAGFVVQGIALHLGSVAAVQPLLATQLMFALPMSSLERRTWPRARDWASAGAICAALVLLLVVVRVAPLEGEADRSRVVLASIAATAAVVVLVPLAVQVGRNTTSLVCATCAGLAFAMNAVFIKLTASDLVDRGVGYTARDWVGYALAASTAVGLVLGQAAYANGPLPWAVATMNAVNPIASYAVGVLAFPVGLHLSALDLAGVAGAGALLLLGAWGLASSPSAWTVLPERGAEAPVRGSSA
jgi:hypothetical protein